MVPRNKDLLLNLKINLNGCTVVSNNTVKDLGVTLDPDLSFGLWVVGLRGGDLCGLYSALSQDGKLVVEDIPLVGWGLYFGKVGGVISFLFGPVRGCPRMGPQCLSRVLKRDVSFF